MLDAAIGEMLEAASKDREEAKEYDKYAVDHILIQVSSLCLHFMHQNPGNKIKALTTRNWTSGKSSPQS